MVAAAEVEAAVAAADEAAEEAAEAALSSNGGSGGSGGGGGIGGGGGSGGGGSEGGGGSGGGGIGCGTRDAGGGARAAAEGGGAREEAALRELATRAGPGRNPSKCPSTHMPTLVSSVGCRPPLPLRALCAQPYARVEAEVGVHLEDGWRQAFHSSTSQLNLSRFCH